MYTLGGKPLVCFLVRKIVAPSHAVVSIYCKVCAQTPQLIPLFARLYRYELEVAEGVVVTQ